MESFTDLDAWQYGMQLVKEIYTITRKFPKQEQYGLTAQIRKAATGILANIAEGFSRSTSADKAYKYTIARGECSEVYAFLLISIELGYSTQGDLAHVLELVDKEGKLLSGLIRKFSR